jgi:hypothetical protein
MVQVEHVDGFEKYQDFLISIYSKEKKIGTSVLITGHTLLTKNKKISLFFYCLWHLYKVFSTKISNIWSDFKSLLISKEFILYILCNLNA